MATPEDVRIPSHGDQLAAYLYRPDSAQGDVPCVVMAHGFSGTRNDGAYRRDALQITFARAGTTRFGG